MRTGNFLVALQAVRAEPIDAHLGSRGVVADGAVTDSRAAQRRGLLLGGLSERQRPDRDQTRLQNLAVVGE